MGCLALSHQTGVHIESHATYKVQERTRTVSYALCGSEYSYEAAQYINRVTRRIPSKQDPGSSAAESNR